MFVFASINTQIEGYADESRFTQLTLTKPKSDTDEEAEASKRHYEGLVSRMASLIGEREPPAPLAADMGSRSMNDDEDIFSEENLDALSALP